MRHAILFLVDGMRPDALQQANTPTMDRLMSTGAWTLGARTVMPSITLPCITSLFLSMPPADHGVISNTWTASDAGAGLFEVVANAGGQAASFYNWEQLRDLSRPGALGAGFYINNCNAPHGAGDKELAGLAAAYLKTNATNLAFVYLGYTDEAGHSHGWMSDAYIAAIENADKCIATVLQSLNGDWLVAVTSDHGGHETHHGTEMDQDMTTPVILYNQSGICDNGQLADPVSILDIAPTITDWMGIAPPASWRGKSLLPES